MTPQGWYRATDGNWYYGGDPRPFASPPRPDGHGGWLAAQQLTPPPPPPPTTSGTSGWARRHPVLTALAALFALGVAGSALDGSDDTGTPRPVAATSAAPQPLVRTETTAPAAVPAPPPETVTATTPAARPSPKPAPRPVPTTAKPAPRPVARTTPAPVRTTVAAPRTDPHFGTCREAIANGYGPYFEGQDEEYDWYRDADNDGEVCER